MKNFSTSCRKMLMVFALVLMATAGFAQQKVTGTIIDQSGEPLIGVSILVKGTTNGTITDLDGNFILPNLKPTDVLEVSYMGYTTQTITVGKQTVLKLTMNEDTQQIDEVVVVGYGKMKKKDMTGSVSSIGTEELTSKGTSSAVEALQGSVAGVNITQASGRVGGGFDVEIRGKSSTNSDTKPIYVVDGVICDDIDWLNPSDIERIDVLKDASSTAIYGSRATAGVIQVSTKTGSSSGKKEQKPHVTYDMYVGAVMPTRMDMFQNAQQFYNYRFLKFLAYSTGDAFCGQPVYTMGATSYPQMALYNDGSQENTKQYAGQYRLKELLSSGETTNWLDMVTRKGFQQNHYVAVSGSSEHVAYHLGVGFNQDQGIYKGDEQNRVNIKGSIDATINKYLQAGVNFNLSWMGNDYANDDAIKVAYRMNPFMQPYDKNGNINEKPGNGDAMGSVNSKYQFSDQVSPLLYMQNRTKQKDTWRALGNIYLQVVPVKGLTIKSQFAPDFDYYALGQFDNTLVSDYKTNVAQLTKNQNFQYTWDNTITYANTFADVHSVNIMGLFSMQGAQTNYQYVKYTGVMDGTLWHNLGTGTYDAANSNNYYTANSMMSWALRANYSYAGKYLVTATVRGDGSSKFAKGHRWGYFPSVALAWRMSEESWMKDIKEITNWKWRLSYGVTGNNAGIADYATIQTVAGPVYYALGNSIATGYYPNAIIDPNLTWETSLEWNAGLDFGFVRDRVTGTIDFYNKVSKDLLYAVELPLEAGGQTVVTNAGSVLNRGVEVGLKTVNVETAGVHWETSLTLAHNTNKVLEINGSGTDLPNDGLFIGQPINNVYGYQFDGIISDLDMVVPDHQIAKDKGFTPGETVKEADYYYACYGQTEGQPKIKDVNGDGKYTEVDKKVYSSDPKITASLTSILTWKGLEFAFQLYGKVGQTVESEFYSEYLNYSDRGRMRLNMDYYIPAGTLIDCDGVNADGTYINPVYQESTYYGRDPFPNNGALNSGLGTSLYLDGVNKIVNTSFLKVKYITLAYSMQKKQLEKLHMQKWRFYCTVTNPFCWTEYKGFDPEWAGTALSNDAPATINVQFGMNINF